MILYEISRVFPLKNDDPLMMSDDFDMTLNHLRGMHGIADLKCREQGEGAWCVYINDVLIYVISETEVNWIGS